jgi:tripartite-type tricarboxylate transporter receptor subunit TctC
MRPGLYAITLVPALIAVNGTANAQTYPSKPIRIISEYTAGNGGDVFFRHLARYMSAATEQTWIIDNRGGAGGLLAVEAAMRTAPDGYTLLAASQNVFVTRRYLSRTGHVDALQDFTPISALWRTTLVIAVHPSMPAKTLAEYIAHAKASPGKIAYTSSGIGTQAHFAGMNLSAMAGISLLHVPYNNARLVQDVVSGDVPSTISIVSSLTSFIRSGRLRPLAIAGSKRIDALPGVPAASETLPGFEPPPTWTALFAPAKLPPAILSSLHASIVKGMAAPEARSKAASDGFELIGNTPEQFAAQIKRDIEVAGRLVKAAKIEPLD